MFFPNFAITARACRPLVAIAATVMLAFVAQTSPVLAQDRTTDAPADLINDGEVDYDVFERALAPHGDWIQHRNYGYVWRPNVDNSWRPYTRGHWANTEEHGWYWVSDESWGWAPYHYGRWVFDEQEEEWLWIRGREWAPAWVQWRESDNAVGWAPLPPDAEFTGSSLSYNVSYYESPRYYRYWTFCAPAVMFLPGLWQRVYAPRTYVTYFASTRPIAQSYVFTDRRIYNRGYDWRRAQQVSGRQVPLVRTNFVNAPNGFGGRSNIGRDTISVYRPRFVARPTLAPSPQGGRGGPDGRNSGFSGRGGVPGAGQTPQVNQRPQFGSPQPPVTARQPDRGQQPDRAQQPQRDRANQEQARDQARQERARDQANQQRTREQAQERAQQQQQQRAQERTQERNQQRAQDRARANAQERVRSSAQPSERSRPQQARPEARQAPQAAQQRPSRAQGGAAAQPRPQRAPENRGGGNRRPNEQNR